MCGIYVKDVPNYPSRLVSVFNNIYGSGPNISIHDTLNNYFKNTLRNSK